ncbi:MAG: hypothetical protein GC155_06165 [Alphaproteobacteria bacterium]|nr:hypothetical protein [Alphaproteobacteria bacterium]
MSNSNFNGRMEDISEQTKPAESVHRLLSAFNTTNATVAKNAPCVLDSIDLWNAGTVTYLKLYDKATAPAETDTPVLTIYLAASLTRNIQFPKGLKFAAGLAYRMTTAGADNSTAAVAAAAVLAMNMAYRAL